MNPPDDLKGYRASRNGYFRLENFSDSRARCVQLHYRDGDGLATDSICAAESPYWQARQGGNARSASVTPPQLRPVVASEIRAKTLQSDARGAQSDFAGGGMESRLEHLPVTGDELAQAMRDRARPQAEDRANNTQPASNSFIHGKGRWDV